MRTMSMDGTISQTRSAMSTSAAVGAPKLRPSATALSTASRTSWLLWPRIIGPQEPT